MRGAAPQTGYRGSARLAEQVGRAAQQARHVAVVQVAVGGDLRPGAAGRPRLHHAWPRGAPACRDPAGARWAPSRSPAGMHS